jgi:tripartite-type tricarboxylate transporter receptor subunit TctC
MKRQIPLILDLAQNDLDFKALSFIASSATLGRPLAAPPGLPPDRLQILRRAFDATMKDPEFLAEAGKANMDIKPLNGDAVQQLATEVAQAPPEQLARAKELIGRKETK